MLTGPPFESVSGLEVSAALAYFKTQLRELGSGPPGGLVGSPLPHLINCAGAEAYRKCTSTLQGTRLLAEVSKAEEAGLQYAYTKAQRTHLYHQVNAQLLAGDGTDLPQATGTQRQKWQVGIQRRCSLQE